MKCIDCPDYKACRRQNDLRRKRHKCKKANGPFVQTNADRIRSMSDEELAAFLYDDGEAMCKDQRVCSEYGCKDCILDWLRQPVKDGDNEG